MNKTREEPDPGQLEPTRSGTAAAPEPEREDREYGHSSGDRNSRTSEDDWSGFKGGQQRDADVGGKD